MAACVVATKVKAEITVSSGPKAILRARSSHCANLVNVQDVEADAPTSTRLRNTTATILRGLLEWCGYDFVLQVVSNPGDNHHRDSPLSCLHNSGQTLSKGHQEKYLRVEVPSDST